MKEMDRQACTSHPDRMSHPTDVPTPLYYPNPLKDQLQKVPCTKDTKTGAENSQVISYTAIHFKHQIKCGKLRA